MDFIVFFKFIDSAQEQDKYFVNLSDLQEWVKGTGDCFEYINACTADEHEEVVFSSVDEIMEAR